MAGCIAGSLHPSLAPGGGPGSCCPVPGLPGRVGCCFQPGGPGAADALPPAVSGRWVWCPPPASVSPLAAQPLCASSSGWLEAAPEITQPWDALVPGEGSLCSQRFPPPCLQSQGVPMSGSWITSGAGWRQVSPSTRGSRGSAGFGCALCAAASSSLSVCRSAVSPETP